MITVVTKPTQIHPANNKTAISNRRTITPPCATTNIHVQTPITVLTANHHNSNITTRNTATNHHQQLLPITTAVQPPAIPNSSNTTTGKTQPPQQKQHCNHRQHNFNHTTITSTTKPSPVTAHNSVYVVQTDNAVKKE